jgi:PEP phosphonomutase and related enzymes
MEKNGSKLKDIINKGELVVAIGAHDALNAKLVEKAGFNAVYIGSYSLEGTQKTNPDINIMTKTEKLEIFRNITNSVNIPVIADMEEGYGDFISVIKIIPEFEATGVLGVQLDDQKIPSKCPFLPGPKNQLIPIDEMCQKIKAAIDTRTNPDFMIIARPVVIGTVSLEQFHKENKIEEVIERGNAYARAGADAIFVMPSNVEELNYYAEKIKASLVGIFSYVAPIPIEEFRKAGYKIVIGANVCMLSAAKGAVNALKILKETEDYNTIENYVITEEEFYDIVDIKKYDMYYKKYGIK